MSSNIEKSASKVLDVLILLLYSRLYWALTGRPISEKHSNSAQRSNILPEDTQCVHPDVGSSESQFSLDFKHWWVPVSIPSASTLNPLNWAKLWGLSLKGESTLEADQEKAVSWYDELHGRERDRRDVGRLDHLTSHGRLKIRKSGHKFLSMTLKWWG